MKRIQGAKNGEKKKKVKPSDGNLGEKLAILQDNIFFSSHIFVMFSQLCKFPCKFASLLVNVRFFCVIFHFHKCVFLVNLPDFT